MKEFLLSDEKEITEKDLNERKKIYEMFSDMPVEFFSKLRHFQPQIGCLNACRICSKKAGTLTSYWTETRQRNVISALKLASSRYRKEKPYIVWNRNEHRSGVIFSYLDNDIGNYYYLLSFIKLCYRELGVQTRISTVGYSRHNRKLNKMHKEINSEENFAALGGVRLSFTPYEIGWSCKNNKKYSKSEYREDIANFLELYKPYYEYAGGGSRKFCVEIRYKPLVMIDDVYKLNYNNKMIIATNNYLYISKNSDIVLSISKISDSEIQSIELTEKPEYFYSIDLSNKFNSQIEFEKYIESFDFNDLINKKTVELYMMENKEGIYYSINPKMTLNGNYGINIYPKTEKRLASGYIITERFLLNSMLSYKNQNLNNVNKKDYRWLDVENVIDNCKKIAEDYLKTGKKEKSSYIFDEILPMIESYAYALKKAGYSPYCFFDPDFTIDTGIICNLGRAIKEFGGITKLENEPLTPTHERNYGSYNSKMTKEGTAWRLSCGYNNTIIIEELNLKNTATKEGQIDKQINFSLDEADEILDLKSLNNEYLVPGQMNSEDICFYKEYGEYGYLASYSEHGFYKDNVYYKTLEHYYQSHKFLDDKIKNKIINAETPKEASIIGRDRNNKLRDNWDKIKLSIMREGLILKFNSNLELKDKLLKTGNKNIVEETTKEYYWGCGIDGTGENNFGKLLMELRDSFMNN